MEYIHLYERIGRGHFNSIPEMSNLYKHVFLGGLFFLNSGHQVGQVICQRSNTPRFVGQLPSGLARVTNTSDEVMCHLDVRCATFATVLHGNRARTCSKCRM